jgi:hypothetical protein
MTTFTISDPQTIRNDLLTDFFENKAKGRVDVWIRYEADDKPYERRLALYRDQVVFSDKSNSQQFSREHYLSIGSEARLEIIIDEQTDADAFADFLSAHQTKHTTTFWLDQEFRERHYAEDIHEWFESFVKHRVLVWRTEGDEYHYDDEETEILIPWIRINTSLIATYDPSDPTAYPSDPTSRLGPWNQQDYELLYVMFTDYREARHFVLSFNEQPFSLENGIEPAR